MSRDRVITLANGREIELSQESYDKLAEEVKVEGRWVPEQYEKYWFVGTLGDVSHTCFLPAMEKWRIKTGNIFKTKEEAEAHKEWLEAKAVIQEDAGWWEPDWSNTDNRKWYGYYRFGCNIVATIWTYINKHAETIHFPSEEAIEASQKKHRAEWLIYLKVEED